MYPDLELGRVCEPVTEFNDELKELTDEMFEIMYNTIHQEVAELILRSNKRPQRKNLKAFLVLCRNNLFMMKLRVCRNLRQRHHC